MLIFLTISGMETPLEHYYIFLSLRVSEKYAYAQLINKARNLAFLYIFRNNYEGSPGSHLLHV